jgi:hypothetical protein
MPSINLDRRLAELEKRAAPDNLIKTIIRCIVDPGILDAEMNIITGEGGECWTRQPGETEDQLLERAKCEATRDQGGFVRLIADSVDDRLGTRGHHARA